MEDPIGMLDLNVIHSGLNNSVNGVFDSYYLWAHARAYHPHNNGIINGWEHPSIALAVFSTQFRFNIIPRIQWEDFIIEASLLNLVQNHSQYWKIVKIKLHGSTYDGVLGKSYIKVVGKNRTAMILQSKSVYLLDNQTLTSNDQERYIIISLYNSSNKLGGFIQNYDFHLPTVRDAGYC